MTTMSDEYEGDAGDPWEGLTPLPSNAAQEAFDWEWHRARQRAKNTSQEGDEHRRAVHKALSDYVEFLSDGEGFLRAWVVSLDFTSTTLERMEAGQSSILTPADPQPGPYTVGLLQKALDNF
jgi:hypothetical protein